MTLKEKFIDAFKSGKRFDIQNAETIADDYAIEFAEWIDKNHKSISLEIYSNKKKVLEIFKKEKGL
jgi:hypothetical protein